MSEILKITSLWGGYKEGVDILRNINLEVQQGEAVGIIGLNGSGKSTLGRAIMNMIPIRQGSIVFEGEDITSLKTHELAHRGLTIMPQGGKVFPSLSVWENLQLAMGNKSLDTQLTGIIPLLQRPKRELMRLMADKLSGGQKHELSLAMTLATNPRLVILDEPSAGLSPIAVDQMYTMLRACREQFGLTIILIEQNIARAVDFCKKSILLQQGVFANIFTDEDLPTIKTKMFNK